jgi:hypothetical protein
MGASAMLQCTLLPTSTSTSPCNLPRSQKVSAPAFEDQSVAQECGDAARPAVADARQSLAQLRQLGSFSAMNDDTDFD